MANFSHSIPLTPSLSSSFENMCPERKLISLQWVPDSKEVPGDRSLHIDPPTQAKHKNQYSMTAIQKGHCASFQKKLPRLCLPLLFKEQASAQWCPCIIKTLTYPHRTLNGSWVTRGPNQKDILETPSHSGPFRSPAPCPVNPSEPLQFHMSVTMRACVTLTLPSELLDLYTVSIS